MPVSWPKVVEVLGLPMANRLDQDGLVVVTASEAEAMDAFSKIAEVALPILEAIATRQVHPDEVTRIAQGALEQVSMDPMPVPSEDLRVQLRTAQAELRQARKLIRDMAVVVRVRGAGRSMGLHDRALKFLGDSDD